MHCPRVLLSQEDNLRNSPEHRNSTGVSSEPTYYMVKFQYPIKKGMKEEVTRLSKDKMLRYLPHDVFIVSMLPSAADKISKLHGVIGVYYLPSGGIHLHVFMNLSLSLNFSDKIDGQMSRSRQISTCT